MPKKSSVTPPPPDIAGPDEILQTITQIMRGEITDTANRKGPGGEELVSVPPKVSERQKAAEMLGKRYGLFADKEAAAKPRDPEKIRQIDDAIRELTCRYESESP